MSQKTRPPLPLLAAVGLVATVLFIFGHLVDDFWLRFLAKPLPVAAMVLALVGLREHRYARTIAVGLGLCIFGDIFLELSDTYFVPGMIAFLSGHVAYIVAFVGRTRRPAPLAALPFAAWIGWAAWFLLPHLGELALPVIAYTLVIFTMMWRATAVATTESPTTRWAWLAMLGALMFGTSDTLIALDKFHAPIAGVRVPIILLYWGGQALIAASALREQ